MKKFYYFSEKTLNFLEIKHFKRKLIAVFTVSVVISSSLLVGLLYFLSSLSGEKDIILNLTSENELLKEKLFALSEDYSSLAGDLQEMSEFSNELRLAANLEPLSLEERLLGTGGRRSLTGAGSIKNADISEVLGLMDEVNRKFEFEKINFEKISAGLKTNKELFESIPAIVPTKGQYSVQSFGMRVHPILKVKKMHNGLDILNDIGTPVKATGKGKVVFVGRKGGYGLAVEIDHGFGYRTVYAHLSGSSVREGQVVRRGDVIARSGNSGLSSGPHLHYEVLHKGQNLNPAEFFFDEYNYFEAKN